MGAGASPVITGLPPDAIPVQATRVPMATPVPPQTSFEAQQGQPLATPYIAPPNATYIPGPGGTENTVTIPGLPPDAAPVGQTDVPAFTEQRPDAVQRFGKGAWDYSLGGFLSLLKGVGSLMSQGFTRPGLPPDPNSAAGQMLADLIESHADQYEKAKQALKNGNYVEAFGHSLATALPLIGPMSAHIGETWAGTDPVFDKYGNVVVPGQEPDTAQALGQMFGLGLSTFAPKAVPPMMRWGQGLGFESKLPPVQQEAVNFLKQEGVPLRAGQLTGNKYLQALEASTAHYPIGSQLAEEFSTGQSQELHNLSGRLAEQAYPTPVSKYEAGQEASLALNKEISDINEQEQAAYERAWEDKDNPEFSERVPVRTNRVPVRDANGKPTGATQLEPVYEDVNMPVDVRWMKKIARQELPKLEYLPAAEQAQSAAFSIYKKILSGPDFISAEQGEEALKGLKGEARQAPSPERRNYSQGAAAAMIPRLQMGIDAAVAKTGQDAVDALRNGRNLHYQKTQIADVADDLRKEPVQAFGQMTMAKDAGADFLKRIADKAPDVMPRLGRAWLDNVFDLASREGDWRRAQTILNKWYDLGEKTKAMMFLEPAMRQALNRFFLGQKITNIPINPSGTALVKAAQEATTNPLKWAQGALLGKLLYTPRGVQFLVKAIENPPKTAAAAAALRSQAGQMPEPPEEPPPTSGGPPTPPAGSPGPLTPPPTLKDRLQTLGDDALDRVRKSGIIEGRIAPSLFPAEVTKDMAIWGAARIANGAIKFSDWSKAMLNDAADISPAAAEKVKAMLPQLWTDSKKQYEHHANTFGAENIADLPKIMQYYEAGKEGKDWYNFVRPALQPIFGKNTDLFLKMFAATSPNTKVTQNVVNAVRAYRQFLLGEQFTGMPAHVDNLNRAVAGVQMSGPKVGAFGTNLMGDLTPVTVDLWMARALLGRDTVTPLQSKLVDYMTSQAAKEKGLQPAEMQAAIWTGIKKLQNSRDTAAPPEQIVNEYLDQNPDVRKLFEDSLQMSKKHFRDLQAKQAPAKPPR